MRAVAVSRRVADERRRSPSGSGQRSDSAPPATGRRACGSRGSPRSPAWSSRHRVSELTHLALFQKYRCGTSSRAGPPCSAASGWPSNSNATQALPPREVRQRQVRRVAAVAAGHHVPRLGVDAVEQLVDGHPAPGGAELRPAGDAVDVGVDRLGAERHQIRPRPGLRRARLGRQGERPVVGADALRRVRRSGRGSRAPRTARAAGPGWSRGGGRGSRGRRSPWAGSLPVRPSMLPRGRAPRAVRDWSRDGGEHRQPPRPARRRSTRADRPAAPTLLDRFGRTARDLRVSVTEKCSLRCTYCMPEEGLPAIPRSRPADARGDRAARRHRLPRPRRARGALHRRRAADARRPRRDPRRRPAPRRRSSTSR